MVEELRRNFHAELEQVRDDLVRAAAMVTEALARATQAFLDDDLTAAENVRQGDADIDAVTLSIEEHCYSLLALQQPMARDLRALTVALRLAGEIERAGDLVSNIMKGARRIHGTQIDPKLRGFIERLSEQTHRLFRLAIDAYVQGDAGLAAAIDDMDDAVDDLHRDYIEALFETRESGELPLQVAVQLAMIGRFYERIGDHAVNIGERVQYMVSGNLPEHRP